MKAQTRTMEDSGHSQMEAWRLKIESWRVCMPVVSDLHNFIDEQSTDPDPHQCQR
jgi:hypothetical protein